MAPIKNRLDLENLVLAHGAHKSFEQGSCIMEAVAYVAGEPHSDQPQCASKVVSAFMRSWNDSLNDTDRQMLKPFVERLIDTVGSEEVEVRRARMAQDWYIREFTPTWLELAGLSDHAQTLRTLNEITSDARIKEAQPALSAAWSAAGSAARSAAWSAAGSAAWSAAGSAAWSAAGSAAWSAAESAAWSAAESAAEQALEPTVRRLQASARDLVDRMLAVTE